MERAVYKQIKRMNRQELSNYTFGLYKKGLEEGLKVNQGADIKVKVIEVLEKTKGVGKKTMENAMQTMREMKL